MAKKSQKRLNKISKLTKSRQNKSKRVKNKMMKKVGGAGWYHKRYRVSFARRNNIKAENCEYIEKMECGKYLNDKEIYDEEEKNNKCVTAGNNITKSELCVYNNKSPSDGIFIRANNPTDGD